MIEYVLMNNSHVRQVAQLEKLCFSMPWDENALRYELTNPLSLWLVASEGDTVVGYVGSQSVIDEADMMNLAIAPAYRRHGIACKLVQKLIESLKENGIRSLTLEVRASNSAAEALYAKLGFKQVGRRPNYYHLPKEDALILRKELQD